MLYPIFAQNSKLRDGLKYALDKAGVETRISFPSVHLQPVYKREFGFKEGQFPVSEHASETVLCLPIFAGLTQKEQDYIIDVIKTFVGKKNHEEK
jgi:perosamine synthetase